VGSPRPIPSHSSGGCSLAQKPWKSLFLAEYCHDHAAYCTIRAAAGTLQIGPTRAPGREVVRCSCSYLTCSASRGCKPFSFELSVHSFNQALLNLIRCSSSPPFLHSLELRLQALWLIKLQLLRRGQMHNSKMASQLMDRAKVVQFLV
jgi:hypothetical protein